MTSTHIKKVEASIFFFRMAGAIILFLFTANFFSVASAADTVEMWQERDEGYERYGGNRQQENWYEKGYQDYEESPYGYYDEDYFYGDFDFEYWDRAPVERDEDWYERRFRSYSDGNGYGYRR